MLCGYILIALDSMNVFEYLLSSSVILNFIVSLILFLFDVSTLYSLVSLTFVSFFPRGRPIFPRGEKGENESYENQNRPKTKGIPKHLCPSDDLPRSRHGECHGYEKRLPERFREEIQYQTRVYEFLRQGSCNGITGPTYRQCGDKWR